ncbi:cyclic peptide export ABC transporter [Pseudoalteromonas rubra]|uniref:ABC transporter permease n=1 Tax=Pseudoalteromonas rubra TaxID=43658 RepID=A0A0F4QUW4_9GAMM|nr:cyclic peptide export ABC transporter [Pseudoalteromonas rubra]KJZ11134.1 ABC transporter permease [Pseudoalteromonas rubra]
MVLNIIKKYTRQIVLCSIVGAVSAFFSIWLISLISESPLESINADAQRWALQFFLGIVGLFTISSLANYFMTKLSVNIIFEVRDNLVKRILNTKFSTLDKIGGHKVLATVSSDVSDISRAISAMPQYIYNLVTVLVCLGFLAYKSPALFGVLVAALPFGLAVSVLLVNRAEKYDEIWRDNYDVMYEQFKCLADGAKELNNNQKRKGVFYNNGFIPSLKQIKQSNLNSELLWNLSENWGQTLIFILLGVILLSHSVFGLGESSAILSFIFVLIFIQGPADVLLSHQESIAKAFVSVRKIDSLDISEDTRMHEYIKDEALCGTFETLKIEGLKFKHDSEDSVFEVGPVDLNINKGELLIINGGNGCGKSTFGKLLVGLYEAGSGSISIDDLKVEEHNKNQYLNLFSVIHSDFYLFDTLIDRDGNTPSDASIGKYLEKLNLHDKVTVVDGRFSTTKLSHGQRKRLALLVAYLEDAPVYFFDEWAADQDPYFREFFYMELLPEMKKNGKTIIVISHDDKYFHIADRLVTFDAGKISRIETNQTDHSSEMSVSA